MKINIKLLLLFDVLVLVLGVITIFWGQQIGDFIHPSPKKAIYASMTSQFNDIYDPIFRGETVNPADMSQKIYKYNQKTIEESNKLYGKHLAGDEQSLNQFEDILNDFKTHRIFEGDQTTLSFYLGQVIINNSSSHWYHDGSNGYLMIKSDKNDSVVDVYDFIFNRIRYGGSEPVIGFYQTSIHNLNGQ